MANVTQNVTLSFKADVSSAKSSIEQLKTSLTQIQTQASNSLHLDADLNSAKQAAKELQAALQSAVNVNTGQLNFTALNAQLQAAGTSVTQLSQQLLLAGSAGQSAFMNLTTAIAKSSTEIQKMSPMLQNMMTTLKNTFKWEMASKAIHGIESTISSAISYVTDLNKTLTDIRIVTGASVDDMTKFTREANTMAKELSATTKDIAKASLIYYQQGDNAELAMKKAAVTTKAANVAFTASAQEMSEMLTAVWNSYKVGEDELERVVDTMAALGATTASSMEEIMTGMEKVSSTAHTVGVSVNQMASIIATAASVTRQAPQQIGTAWNTILSRFSSLKLGETLEDGLTLTKYTSALQSIGVEVMDATGQLRNMGDVISDIGETWKTMTTAQKAALATTVGSVRQMNQMIAFFDNYDKYEKNLQTAENGAGTLQEQQDTFAEGYEAAANRAKAAMQKLYGSLVDDQALIGLKNAMAGITDVVADLVQGLGGIPGILGIVANSFTHTFSNTMATKIASMASSVTTFMAHPLTNISNSFQDWNARRTGQLTRDEQTQIKDIDKTRSQIQSEIGMAGSYNNQALQEQLTLSDQILQKKQELITTSKNLSDADISNREKAIDLATQELAAIDQQRQKYETLKQAKENMFSVNTKYLAANGVDSTGWTRDDTSRVAATFVQNSLSQPGNAAGAQLVSNFNGDQTMESISKVFESAEMATTGLTKFESALKSLSASSAEMQTNQTTLSGAIAGFEAVMDEAGIEGSAYKDKLDEIKRAYQDYQTAVASGDKDQAATAFENVRAKIPDIIDLIQKLRQELTTGSGQLGDIIDQGDEGRAERLRGKVDELAIALFGVKTQGQGVKDSLEQAFGSTALDAKLQAFGKNMTKITSGLTGAVATFSQMSNLTKNWDTSSLTSKITSIGSTLMSIVNSKSIVEMAIKAGGAIIGGIIGAVEADAKRKAEALKELNKQVADSNQKNKESLDTYQETKNNFEELYRQKLQGLDVDDQLKASAQELGLSYDALQTSTDDVADSTAKLAQKIKEVTAAQRERMQLDADAAVTQAKKAMGDTDYGFKSSTSASPGQQIMADMASGAYSITAPVIESYFYTDYMKALQGWAADILEIDTSSLPQDITKVTDMINYVNQVLKDSGEELLEPEEYPRFMSQNEYMAQTLYGLQAQFRYNNGTGASISPLDYAKQAGIDVADEAAFVEYYSDPKLWAALLNQGVAITHSGFNGPWTLDTTSIISGGNYKFQRAVENDYNQAKPESGLNAIAATGYSKVNAQGAVFSNIGLKAEDLKGDAYAALKAYNGGTGAKGLRLFANEYEGYAGNIGFLMSQDESEDYQLAAYDDMIEMERILEASGQTESNLYKQLKERTDKMKETVEAYRTGLENADLLWSEGIGTTMLLSGRSEDSMEFEDFAATMDSIKAQAKQRTQDRADPTAAADTLLNNAQNTLTGFDDYIAIWNTFEQLEEKYAGDNDKLEQLHQLRSEIGQHIGPNGEYSASDFSSAVIEDMLATPSDQRWQAGSKGMQTLATTQKTNAAAVLSTNYTKLQDLESAIKTNPTDADLAAMKTIIDWDKYDTSYADFVKLSAKGQKRKVGQWRKQELTNLQTNKNEQLTAVNQEVDDAQAAVNALSKTDTHRAQAADQFIETIDWQTGNSVSDKTLSYTQKQLQTAYKAALQQGEEAAAEWRSNYNQGNWDKLGLKDEEVVKSLTTVRDAKKALKQAQTKQTALTQDLADIGVLLGQFSDDVLSDVTTLSNAYSTLPTTTEGMDEVIELLNNAGIKDAEGNAYTAESLSALYKSDKKTYQFQVKSALSHYAKDETLSTTGKQIAANAVATIDENEALDEKNKQVTKLANNATKYKDQISSLQSAIKEFVTDGQLSSKTKSTLEKLGLKPNDYKDLQSLKNAMSNARTELVKTRDTLKDQLGIQDFTGSVQDATMTWDEFKEHYKLQDDNLKSAFESWKTSFWDAKTAYDGWSDSAIEAQARITKSVNAHKLAQDKLTTNYNNLKAVSDDVTKAFQNNEQVSMATAKKLKEQGVTWQKGQEANLSNYGKVLGNTAIAQQQMLQGQKYDLNKALQTTGPYYMGLTHGANSFTQELDLATTDLRQFVNEYDDIVPISEKLAGGDGTVAQKIQEMVKEAKEAGKSITWNDIFEKLTKENLEFDDQIAGVWDSFAQSGISAIQSVLSEHQSAAEEIVNIWTQAFQAIAAAQTTFAKGLNLNQDNDESTLATQASLLLGTKNEAGEALFTADQVSTLIQGGSVTIGDKTYDAKEAIALANQQLELPTGATWATSKGGATQFLYRTDTIQGKQGNTWTQETRATNGQEMIDNGRAVFKAHWQDYIKDMDKDALQAFKDAAKQEKNLEGDVTDAWEDFAIEYLMNQYFGKDYESHKDKIFQDAQGAEIAYGAYYSGQKQKNAETAAQAGYSNIYQNDLSNQIAETQKTQAAIDKALSLKLSGKNLGTNLSEDEQSRVLAATGAADIASVQLGDLSSASSNAAAALAQLASAAAALAEQTNKDNGFEKGADNRWYYKETKSSDQLSESDLATGQWTDNGDGTYSRLNYSEAVTTQMRTFDSAAQEALDTVNNFNTNLLSQYADALGETVDTIGSYCEAIAMANGITMDWNNLTQEQQLLMAEAAIRFNETADAIQSLNTLGKDNGVVEALLGTAKQSEIDSMTMQDYAQAYRDIVNAVNDLYGEGAVSAEFFNAATEAGKEHLELLTEIAEGGEKAAAAMEKLQRAVLDNFNTKNKLGFSSSELDDLSGINVKYGEQINDADLARINNLSQQHRLTAAQLKDLGNILGVTLDINQETRSAPTDLKGVQDAVQKIGKEARSTQKAADIAALIKADTKAFKGYNGEADEAKAKTQAIQDAWQQVADSGDIEQTAQAAADLAKTLNGVEGTEVKIEFNEDEIGSELANTLNSLPNVEAQIDYVANLPQIAPADVDADGTITYHTEGGDISFHTETKTATATNSSSGGGHVSVMGLSVPFSYSYSGTSTMSASVPVLDGASASGGTGNQASNSNNGGRGGGGGGGGGRRTKQLKDDHDRTRYHQMDRQLKKQNDLLTKNDKLKSRKYGSGYLDSLKAENKELKNQIDLNKEKIKEAQKYLEKDKKELEQNGATFDEDGNIDYDAYEKKWQDEYNRMVEQYNNGSMDDDEWTEFQRKYDNAMDAVERYEEAQDRIAEAQEEILEAQNQISANKLEMVTYELELKVELDQRQIDLLQTMLKLYENDLDKSSKLLTNYIEQMRLLQHQSNAAPEALANLMSQAGISSLDNIKQDKDGFIIPTVDGFDGDKMTVSDFAEGLKSIADQAQSSLDAIIEMRETMLSFYSDVIDKGEEKFSALANTMKHLNNMMSGYLELVDLYNTGGDVWDKKATIMEAQYDTQLQTIDMYEARMKLYQQQETELEAELQKDPTNEAAKRALEDLKETKEQAEEEWLDAVKTAAQTAKDLYENSVDEIMDQMNKLNGDDMDWLKTKADLWKKNNDLYVDDVTKIYEVDKLTRKIEDSIADTRSKSNQAELKALKEKIKLQADSNELSEYDIEMMNKEYELLLAKQELENAKDAKNQVRLTRDENGNMIYQYTTDQDAVSEAEQKYNDVLYEMHKTSQEHLNDLYENLEETEEAYKAAVEQIWHDLTLTEEEKYQRIEEVNEAYGKVLDNLGSQIQTTYGNLTDYDTRLSNRFAEELKGTAFDTDKYLNTTLVAMADKAEDFKNGMINCQTALKGALDAYSNRVDSLQEHTHTKWEDMTSDLGKFKTAATNTKNETDKLIETLKKSLEDAMTRIIKDFKNWNSEIEKTIKNLSSMIDKINAVLTALASLGDDRRDGGRRDGDDGRRDGDDGRRDGGRRDGDDGRRDGGDDRRGGGGTHLSGWKYDATHHWRQNLDTGAIVQKAAHTYSGPITNGTKCTVCGRQVTAYTPKSYNPDPSPTQTQQPTSSGTKPKVDSRVRVPGSVRAATGGLIDYTGPAWVDGTEPNPEYVLNADQTKMMFGILSSGVMDKLLNALIYAAQAMSMTSLNANNLANSYTSALSDASSSVQQTVYVKADFPAATDKQEIVSALTEIYNKTSHYVNRQTTVGL